MWCGLRASARKKHRRFIQSEELGMWSEELFEGRLKEVFGGLQLRRGVGFQGINLCKLLI